MIDEIILGIRKMKNPLNNFRFFFVVNPYRKVPDPRRNSSLIYHCKGLDGFDDVIVVIFLLSPNTFFINDTLNILGFYKILQVILFHLFGEKVFLICLVVVYVIRSLEIIFCNTIIQPIFLLYSICSLLICN